MRILPRTPGHYPWYLRPFFASQRRRYGQVLLPGRLRGHFSEDAVVELTGLVAFQNLSSKFNAALDVPPQGFCQVPPPGPAAGEPAAGNPGAGTPGP